jgi:hypothetical protein
VPRCSDGQRIVEHGEVNAGARRIRRVRHGDRGPVWSGGGSLATVVDSDKQQPLPRLALAWNGRRGGRSARKNQLQLAPLALRSGEHIDLIAARQVGVSHVGCVWCKARHSYAPHDSAADWRAKRPREAKLYGLARSVPTLVRLPISSPHGRSSNNIGRAAFDPTYPIGRLLSTVRDGGARLAKPADGSDSAADRRPTSKRQVVALVPAREHSPPYKFAT